MNVTASFSIGGPQPTVLAAGSSARSRPQRAHAGRVAWSRWLVELKRGLALVLVVMILVPMATAPWLFM